MRGKMWKKREKIFFFHIFFYFTENKHKLCPYAKFHSDSSKNEDRSPKCIQMGKQYPPL